MNPKDKKRETAKKTAETRARVKAASVVKARGFDPLTTNRRRRSLGGGVYEDTLIDKRGLHDLLATGQKPWNVCGRFMCKHPTESGESEKDPGKRLCRYHSPQAVAVRKDQLEAGHARRMPCSPGSRKFCKGALGPVILSMSKDVCLRKIALEDCTLQRKVCQTEADFYYAHHQKSYHRYTDARWKRKTLPWRFGDPTPPCVWDDEEGVEDDL